MCQLRTHAIAVFLMFTLASVTHSALAQTARSGGGGAASAQLLQQMQQLASERTTLQAENAKLKKDLEDMRKERDAVKNTQQALDRRAKSSEGSLRQSIAQRESTDKELTQTKEKMQQLISKFKETLGTLREIETQNTTAKQTLATRDRELKVCVDHNQALYKLNQEVLTRFENQSMWTRAAKIEPFTKIKRVQLENLVDDYKGRADEERVAPAPSTPPSSTSPSAAPPSTQNAPPAAPAAAPPATGQPATSGQPTAGQPAPH